MSGKRVLAAVAHQGFSVWTFTNWMQLLATWSSSFRTPSSAFLKRNCRADFVLPHHQLAEST